MKEKELFWGKLLVSWEKNDHPWDVDIKVSFWSTWDIQLGKYRVIFEWD